MSETLRLYSLKPMALVPLLDEQRLGQTTTLIIDGAPFPKNLAGLQLIRDQMPELRRICVQTIVGLKALRALEVGSCQLLTLNRGFVQKRKGDVSAALGLFHSQRLELLSLTSWPLTSEHLPHLARYAQLTQLRVAHCTKLTSADFQQLASYFPNLRFLDVTGCTLFDDAALAAWKQHHPTLRIFMDGTATVEAMARYRTVAVEQPIKRPRTLRD